MDAYPPWSNPQSQAHRQNAERQFETVRRTSVTALVGVLAGFWGDIEEQVRLAAIASHDNRAIYDDRMAIQLLSQRALELASRYRESLEQAFDRWRNPRPRAVETNKGLSLMSEGELETHLAGQQVVELLEHQLMHPLHLLNERMEVLGTLLGLPLQTPETNPMRAEVAVGAFVKLLGDQELTPELRRLLFLQLEKRLSKTLPELYDKIIAQLEHQKVDPAALAARRQADQEDAWSPDGGLVEGRQPNRQPGQQPHPQSDPAAQPQSWGADPHGGAHQYRYRESIHRQIRAWRRTVLGSATPSPTPRPGAGSPAASMAAFSGARGPQGLTGDRVLAPQELFGIASLLQGHDPAPYVRALSGDDPRSLSATIRAQIASGSRQLGYDPTQMRFDEVDEDAIDLVAILLQTLAQSHAPSQRSRAMYGRLVVPYLKLALSDSALFDEHAHPGRRLLEALSEACDGNTGETPQDQQTLTHAELAVERVVGNYRDDQAIFELAATELRDHLDQQRRMREIAELRAAESVHGRERLLHARRTVDEQVQQRLQQRPLTAGIAEFISGHWRHHLVQTWLREGAESAQYLAALAVGDGLIQADADAADARGAQVAARVIELQGPLGRVYANCGLDATAARESMARIVTALAFPDQPRTLHPMPSDEQRPEVSDAVTWGGLRLAGGTDGLRVPAERVAEMRRLKIGQTLRLIEEDGRDSIGRIAWLSPLTNRFLVVNRRGMRKLVVSPEELAALVDKGRIEVRSSDPPFEEAMRAMWQQLNPPQSNAAGA